MCLCSWKNVNLLKSGNSLEERFYAAFKNFSDFVLLFFGMKTVKSLRFKYKYKVALKMSF